MQVVATPSNGLGAQMDETTADLLERAEKAVKHSAALRRENELLVAEARRLMTLVVLEKLRYELYGPARN